jgi:hypothetical protein
MRQDNLPYTGEVPELPEPQEPRKVGSVYFGARCDAEARQDATNLLIALRKAHRSEYEMRYMRELLEWGWAYIAGAFLAGVLFAIAVMRGMR